MTGTYTNENRSPLIFVRPFGKPSKHSYEGTPVCNGEVNEWWRKEWRGKKEGVQAASAGMDAPVYNMYVQFLFKWQIQLVNGEAPV